QANTDPQFSGIVKPARGASGLLCAQEETPVEVEVRHVERQQAVLDILQGLDGLEPLKKLFWSELSYSRVNRPLSRKGWGDDAADALAGDPVLFAAGGDDFHIIHARLVSDRLPTGAERPVVSRLLQQHPYALFVFSNGQQN